MWFCGEFFEFVGLVGVCVLGFVFVGVCVCGCVWFGFGVIYYVVMGDLMGVCWCGFWGCHLLNLPTKS